MGQWCHNYPLKRRLFPVRLVVGDTLWFWLDAHEIDCDILLELTVNSVAPLAGQPFYTLAGGIKTLKTLAPAWEGQTNARIPVAGGYTGWIGLPLSAFAEPISEVRQLQLYTQPWAGDIPAADMPVDKSLYFDDLCLIRSSASAEEEDAHGDLFNQNVAPNDILLYVDTTQRHQEIKAFGVSDAWWALVSAREAMSTSCCPCCSPTLVSL